MLRNQRAKVAIPLKINEAPSHSPEENHFLNGDYANNHQSLALLPFLRSAEVDPLNGAECKLAVYLYCWQVHRNFEL
jgi:hypothetical protein